MQNITFVTGNPNKAQEASMILGMEVLPQKVEIPEIQSWNLEEIVRAKAAAAFQVIGAPVIIEDVAFDIEALNGFPGPFIKFWAKAGCHDLDAIIAEALGNDRAAARSGVGYADGKQVLYVESRVDGRVCHRRAGEGWGFDFYFIPDGSDKTFSEMGKEVKNKQSHRSRALLMMKRALERL